MKIVLFAALLTTMPAAAADGETLHHDNCIRCHAASFGGDGAGIYTRENRRVRSLPALERQVKRCRDNIGLLWFDEDVAAVVNYLNGKYYRFAD